MPEPGLWLQWDYGDGPVLDGAKTVLFVAWLAWSRFRVVLAMRDRTMPSVIAALDTTFRLIGGVPTYALTDNERTVTDRHVAGIAVCNKTICTRHRRRAAWVRLDRVGLDEHALDAGVGELGLVDVVLLVEGGRYLVDDAVPAALADRRLH